MKKLKIKKRLTSFLMLVVMAVSIVGVLPKSVAYADDTLKLPDCDFRRNYFDNERYFDLYKWDPSCIGDAVSFWNAEKRSFTTAIISTSPLKASYTEYNYTPKYGGGSELSMNRECTSHSGSFEARGKKYYYVWYSNTNENGNIGYQIKKGICFGSKDFNADDAEEYIRDYILDKLPTSFTVIGEDGVDTNAVPDGTADNPFEDKDIGRLVIKKGKAYFFNTGKFHQQVETIQWAKKSDSGFSLLDNDYALTRIEVKIGNRNMVYGDIEGHGKPKKVDNFGEVYPFKYVSPKDNPYDFGFTDMMTASKTDLTKYNPSMLAHEYDLYFRIVCSDAIGTSAKFYCGEWTRYRVTDAVNQKGDNESDNGHFDDDGKWVKEEDTKVDSGGISSVTDDDEKDEDFDSFDDPENFTPNIDNIKSFFKQLGNVPKAIGKLFSFLPSWVTDYVAFGFVVLVALMVIKAIRG